MPVFTTEHFQLARHLKAKDVYRDQCHPEVIAMKKVLCVALVCLLIGTTALAGAPKLSDSLFGSAKKAVGYLASGEYERLVTLLPISDSSPSASEWERFADNYSNLSHIQSDYAVAFWTGSIWVVAVPMQVPDSGSVEVLALSSEDGSSFNGYRYATWSQIEKAYSDSSRVVWNREYVGENATVVAD